LISKKSNNYYYIMNEFNAIHVKLIKMGIDGRVLARLFAMMAVAGILGAQILYASSQKSSLVQQLDSGKKQTLVFYGTSLTAMKGGWASQLSETLKMLYGERVTIVNSARGGMDSKWGLENLSRRVLVHRPNAVTIEFSMNDAAKKSGLSVAESRKNLETMVDCILELDKNIEIFILTMNPVGTEIQARAPGHSYYRGKLEEYYRAAGDVANDRGIKLIDHYSNWMRYRRLDPCGFAKHVPDGVHPDIEISRELILPAMLSGLGVETTVQRRTKTIAIPEKAPEGSN
jgi:lysophospholipase L1-like esterase